MRDFAIGGCWKGGIAFYGIWGLRKRRIGYGMGVFSGERAKVMAREVISPVVVGVNHGRVRLRGLINEVYGEYGAL